MAVWFKVFDIQYTNDNFGQEMPVEVSTLADENFFNHGFVITRLSDDYGDGLKVIDWGFWLAVESWTPEEALCLLNGINPHLRVGDGYISESIHLYNEFLAQFYRLAKPKGPMSPFQWKHFAQERQYWIPKPIWDIQTESHRILDIKETGSSAVTDGPQAEAEDHMGSENQDDIESSSKTPPDTKDCEEKLAALFDPVTVTELEKMFPTSHEVKNGKWKNWAERAARNGLETARVGRGLFNPYKAGLWFLNKKISGWDLARINRTLANNLPARSRDDKYLITGELD